MQFALVGAIGYIFAHAFAAPSIPIVLCGALAAASAAEREHAAGLRRVSFFAMPLFGRQLARAHAIAPVLSALSVPLGFVVGSAFRDAPPAPVTIAIALLATIVAVLVSLSSVFRDGARAALYVGLESPRAPFSRSCPTPFRRTPSWSRSQSPSSSASSRSAPSAKRSRATTRSRPRWRTPS
jgi:hypothetical protein